MLESIIQNYNWFLRTQTDSKPATILRTDPEDKMNNNNDLWPSAITLTYIASWDMREQINLFIKQKFSKTYF